MAITTDKHVIEELARFFMRAFEPAESNPNEKEKMTYDTYRLRNGQRAVIDKNGMGVTDDGILRSWLVTTGGTALINGVMPYVGGVMGAGFDAMCPATPDPRLLHQFMDAVRYVEEPTANLVLSLQIPVPYPYIPNQPTETKENDMSDVNKDGFKSIDYFNGYPVNDLSDEAIFDLIGTEQEKLKKLEKAPMGPAADAHTKRIQDGIDQLAAAVNARYPVKSE